MIMYYSTIWHGNTINYYMIYKYIAMHAWIKSIYRVQVGSALHHKMQVYELNCN